jgi:hypothetical protein
MTELPTGNLFIILTFTENAEIKAHV